MAEQVSIDYGQRLVTAHTNLEQYLKSTLGVTTNDELYGVLLSSPNYYPMLRTMQISLDTKNQQPNYQEMAAHKEFLQNLIADEDVRPALGYQGYSTAMLTLLLNSVTNIERNLQGLNNATAK